MIQVADKKKPEDSTVWQLVDAVKSIVGAGVEGTKKGVQAAGQATGVSDALGGWSTEGTFIETLGNKYQEAIGATDPQPQMAPEIELKKTEAPKPDGGTATTTTTRVSMNPATGATPAKTGTDMSFMRSSLANAMEPSNAQLPASIDFSSLGVPEPVNKAGADERDRRTYAPFLPTEKHQGFARIMMSLAHVLSQNEQDRKAYHQSLDENFKIKFTQDGLKEQQKRAKMYGELQEQNTLLNLQRYERSMNASQNLAAIIQRYGSQIFTDPEVNAGARMMAGMAGTPGAIPAIPQYKPTKASRYDLYRAEKRRQSPGISEAEINRQYAADTSKAGGSGKDLDKLLFSTDPLQARMLKPNVKAFLTRIMVDPEYVQMLVQEQGVELEQLYEKIKTFHWDTMLEWAEESGVPIEDL